MSNPAGEHVAFEAEKVLVAVGRKANTAALNLNLGGVANEAGKIIVNDHMQTNIKSIYAIGDCVKGHAQLAHAASRMGEIAAENIMGLNTIYDESTNPTCVYMEPEAAAVGLREGQLKAGSYKVGTFPMIANGKALIVNGGEGFIKIIADTKTEKIIGIHMIGPRATDLIAEGAVAIRMGMKVDELTETIHSHPTISEAVREAALSVQGRTLNMPPIK
ncbi:pyridine nucleotide-disulfide oxidoreductase, dimerization domain protein [Pseudoramibacter alactolyticus ATCC 23263]|uniref:Pyridine nucleotide-disulfide oxidoreductase, dimerization domain protein n=1 Tax=Pseudoramibacter alactolyticus ATCC 23263 TaxID=887929 RepID=E6ME76_9FIRM|nr:pyridine nucleotide-disulfide oxidoreductase, dimerization domain protein [Pseudoramibacter alactolyticus ATCC 23263]